MFHGGACDRRKSTYINTSVMANKINTSGPLKCIFQRVYKRIRVCVYALHTGVNICVYWCVCVGGRGVEGHREGRRVRFLECSKNILGIICKGQTSSV